MKFKEYYGKKKCDEMKQLLEDLFESNGGFLIIGNLDKGKVSDAYYQICSKHVMEGIKKNIKSAKKIGILK